MATSKNKINLINLSLLSTILISCNYGYKNDNAVANTAPIVGESTQKIKKLSTSNQQYALQEVELGWGYDTDTNTVIPSSGAYDASKLIATLGDAQPGSIVITEADKYLDFSKYSHDADASASAEKYEAKGGGGGSYGLYEASVKFKLEKAMSYSSSSLEVTENAGFVREQRSHLLVDARTKITSNNVKQTAEALMEAVPGLKEAIEKIRNARSSIQQNEAILDFYANFGTNVVTSVTRGYVGYHQMRLKQNEASSSSSLAASAEIGFSGPFVNGNASFSAASSDSYSKSNWTFSSETRLEPFNSELKQMLDNLFGGIDSQINAQHNIFDLSKIKVDPKEVHFPDISTMQYAPNKDLMQALSEKKALRAQVSYDIDTLGVALSHLKNLLEERDALPEDDRGGKNQEIEAYIKSNSELQQILNKFNGKDYLSINLSSQQALILNNVKYTILALRKNLDTSAAQLANYFKANDDNKQAEINRQRFLKEMDFTQFLRQEYDHAHSSETFVTWFNNLSADEVKVYAVKWKEDLIKEGLIQPQSANNPRGLAKARSLLMKTTLVATKSSSQHSTIATTMDPSGSNAKPVVLDFNIMPWSIIFPELSNRINSSAVDLIKEKFISKINKFNMERSYLLRVISLDQNSKNLDEMATKDTKVENELDGVLTAIRASYNKGSNADVIIYHGRDFNVMTDTEDFSNLIDNILNKSQMYNSEWYKVTKALENKEILNPQGVLLEFSSGENPKTDEEAKLISVEIVPEICANSADNIVYSKYTNAQKNVGQQLTYFIHQQNQVMFTALPIVTSNSKISSDGSYVSGVRFLLSNGDIIPFNNNLFLTSKSQDMYQPTYFVKFDGGSLGLNGRTWAVNRQKSAKSLLISPITNNTLSSMIHETSFSNLKTSNPLFKLYYAGSIEKANMDSLAAIMGIY